MATSATRLANDMPGSGGTDDYRTHRNPATGHHIVSVRSGDYQPPAGWVIKRAWVGEHSTMLIVAREEVVR